MSMRTHRVWLARLSAVAAVSALLTACATPKSLVADGPSAELAFTLDSQSPGGGMGQHWHVWKFDDATCQAQEKGVLVARKRRKTPLAPIRLPAGRPVTLAFWYIEANFAQNKECSYTWTFTPTAGETYTVDLKVSPYVMCAAGLGAASGAAPDVDTPVNSCVTGLLGRKIPNGEPATITYSVKMY